MFALMDTDNDGKVTYEELKAGLRKVGSQLAEPEIKLMMDVVNFQFKEFKIILCLMLSGHFVFPSVVRILLSPNVFSSFGLQNPITC